MIRVDTQRDGYPGLETSPKCNIDLLKPVEITIEIMFDDFLPDWVMWPMIFPAKTQFWRRNGILLAIGSWRHIQAILTQHRTQTHAHTVRGIYKHAWDIHWVKKRHQFLRTKRRHIQ